MRKAPVIFYTMLLISCSKLENAAAPPPSGTSQPDAITTATNACAVQDGKALQVEPRRAVGTEPFWGARIEGRCVHYSHVENQNGSRVLTRYAKSKDGEIWSGQLDGQPFEIKLHDEAGCSDGMSDKKYPIAANLNVGGAFYKGCAEPIKD